MKRHDLSRPRFRALNITYMVTLILLLAAFASAQSRKDRREDTPFVVAGNVLYLALPASAFAYSAAIWDVDGMKSACLSVGSAVATTYILKYAVGRPCPFEEKDVRGTSFPSGHTTIAFAGAAQWQRRYGWAFGAPAYALAAATGYSRVWGGWHYWSDVAVGAVIGTAAPYIFTKSYNKVSVSGSADHISVSLIF